MFRYTTVTCACIFIAYTLGHEHPCRKVERISSNFGAGGGFEPPPHASQRCLSLGLPGMFHLTTPLPPSQVYDYNLF